MITENNTHRLLAALLSLAALALITTVAKNAVGLNAIRQCAAAPAPG